MAGVGMKDVCAVSEPVHPSQLKTNYGPIYFDPSFVATGRIVVTHYPATNPHPEQDSDAGFLIPESHFRNNGRRK